jgi:lactoylglutathione lyase
MRAKPIYVGLRVKDLEKSIEFYTKFLGMKFTGKSKIVSSKGEVANLESENGGSTIGLNYYERDSPQYSDYVVGEGLDHLAFQIEDLDHALEIANSMAYTISGEVKGENSRWAYVEDPNGMWIELVT